MYVFWFNSQQGKDDTLYCAKVIKQIAIFKDHNRTFIQVEIHPDSPLSIKKGKSWISVPEEEGVVYKRRFWLEEEDINRAIDIQNDYLKQKWLDAQEQVKKLKEKYGF